MTGGIVFTIEPGLYPGRLGGFRHSYAVGAATDGLEALTEDPTDIDSLVIEV